MSDWLDDRDRFMARLLRRARRPTHDWLVTVGDDGTVTLHVRGSSFTAQIHGLDDESRARLASARNDRQVHAALGDAVNKALLDGMRAWNARRISPRVRGGSHG